MYSERRSPVQETRQRKASTDVPLVLPIQYQTRLLASAAVTPRRKDGSNESIPARPELRQPKASGGRHGYADLVGQHRDEHQGIGVLDDELDYFIHGKGFTEPLEQYFGY